MRLLRKLTKLNWFPRRYAGGHAEEYNPHSGYFGENLPFSVDNPPKTFAIFAIACFTGFAFPYYTLRRMILAKKQ